MRCIVASECAFLELWKATHFPVWEDIERRREKTRSTTHQEMAWPPLGWVVLLGLSVASVCVGHSVAVLGFLGLGSAIGSVYVEATVRTLGGHMIFRHSLVGSTLPIAT